MNRKIIGILVCTLLIATTLPVATSMTVSQTNEKIVSNSSGSDWPMFRHDNGNTGCTDSPAPEKNSIRWKKSLSSYMCSEPIVGDNKVFITTHGGDVYCFNSENGRRLWNNKYNYESWAYTAIYDNGYLYFQGDEDLFWVWASDGALKQKNIHSKVSSHLTLANDRIYFSNNDGKIVCVNKNNINDFIWEYQTGEDGGGSTPTVVNGKVIAGSKDGKVYCLDANGNGDGTTDLIWTFTTDNSIIGCSPAVANGKVYIASWDRYIYCLDENDGDFIWSFNHSGVVNTPVIYENKLFFRAFHTGEAPILYCLDSENGNKIWQIPIGDSDDYACPVIADGKLYIGGGNTVYCLNPNNGEVIWQRWTSGNDFYLSVANGMLYACATTSGLARGRIYCFGNIIRSRAYDNEVFAGLIQRILDIFPFLNKYSTFI